ncbi:MAG: signal peptidase I [Roseburia sp.]|nr:signal peptidase I [Roseburia sp.]
MTKITLHVPDDNAPEEEPFNLGREIISLLGTVAVAAIAVLLLKEFVIINAFIPSGSMENTIQSKDRIIGNRLAYVFNEPERGDIVIFKYPDDENQLFVKRIIGLPGETVTIEEAKIYIGEEMVLLEESYLKEEWVTDNGPYTFEVPEGSYLVLGDNRNNSKDARYWENTYVEADKILGEAVFRYWPFDSIGMLD